MSVNSPITKSDNWFRNEDKTFEFTIFLADGVTPEDISGFDLEFELCSFDKLTSHFTKISASSAGGIVITDGPNGILQVNSDQADTAALTAGKFSYELRRIDAGNEAVLAEGTAVLQQACA